MNAHQLQQPSRPSRQGGAGPPRPETIRTFFVGPRTPVSRDELGQKALQAAAAARDCDTPASNPLELGKVG